MVEDGDAICASLLQLRNAFCRGMSLCDLHAADFLAVEGLHRNAAVCHCVYFLDCPDCRVPLCSLSRVFFLLRFLSAIVSGE